MNDCSFFQSLLNIDESENFSDFKTNDKFMLSSVEKIEIDVCETLNSAISVWSSLIIVNRVWTILRMKIMIFMMCVMLWWTKKNNEKKMQYNVKK